MGHETFDFAPLPKAAAAMRYAIELAGDVTASALDLDRARTWVVIAAELRAGEIASASVRGVRLDYAGETSGARVQRLREERSPEEASARLVRLGLMPESRRFGEERPDETVKIDAPAVCGQDGCGFAIGLATPPDGSAPFWAHLTTRQRVCPGTPKNGGHTYAIPKVDARG